MAITMKNLNDRIAALEGKASTTPITMKDLSDRLDNIEATAKKWEIINIPLSVSGKNLIGKFDTKFDSYNYAIISISTINCLSTSVGEARVSLSVSTTSVNGSSENNGNRGSYNISKTSGTLTISCQFGFYRQSSASAKILFYK